MNQRAQGTIRETLEFYANSEWNDDYPGGITYRIPGGAGPYLDTGQRAKQALILFNSIHKPKKLK